ncbi:L-histidine N(Alpha)-methyltransferase [Candidatus Electrothrix gigas]
MKQEYRVADKFKEDCEAFFLGQTAGNLWPYLYGEPTNEDDPVRGSILYNELLKKENDYYLYNHEAELLQTSGKYLASLIGADATLIEMGPGGEKSFRHKTLPFLKAFPRLHGYVGIDVCQDFLTTILEIVHINFPDLFITGLHQDFTQLEKLTKFPKAIIFFKGSTVGNLRNGEVQDLLSRFRCLISEGHYLVITNDANQDEMSLMKAYNTSRVAPFIENVMHRIKRDLNLTEMIPNAFRYQPEWIQETHDFRHILTATSEQEFHIGEQFVKIDKGQKLHIMSSFKYPVDFFRTMVVQAGFEPVEFFLDSSERMAVHLFRAI